MSAEREASSSLLFDYELDLFASARTRIFGSYLSERECVALLRLARERRDAGREGSVFNIGRWEVRALFHDSPCPSCLNGGGMVVVGDDLELRFRFHGYEDVVFAGPACLPVPCNPPEQVMFVAPKDGRTPPAPYLLVNRWPPLPEPAVAIGRQGVAIEFRGKGTRVLRPYAEALSEEAMASLETFVGIADALDRGR